MDTAQLKNYIDLNSGLTRMMGNEKLFRQLLNMFLANTEFDAFEASLAAGDYPGAEAHMHAIKGLSGNLSMPALFSASTALDEQLKAGHADAEMLAIYRDAYVQTKQAVTELLAAPSLSL